MGSGPHGEAISWKEKLGRLFDAAQPQMGRWLGRSNSPGETREESLQREKGKEEMVREETSA